VISAVFSLKKISWSEATSRRLQVKNSESTYLQLCKILFANTTIGNNPIYYQYDKTGRRESQAELLVTLLYYIDEQFEIGHLFSFVMEGCITCLLKRIGYDLL
jgi:hypothetical protein